MDAAVSSSTDKSLQQNPAVRRRQMRQKVLNRIRKVNIKNKGSKSFYYFTYETVETKDKDGSTASTYFFNGEPCEGDEQFLKQMKRSVFVSNIEAGTRKSEIKELFDRYGRIENIQLKTRSGETIVGRQHISPYSPIVGLVKFSKKEEAEKACETKDGKFQAKLFDQNMQYDKENCICVDNIDPKIIKTELREYYSPFGTILNISLQTNDGSLILTDKEYQKLSVVCCYIRFSRRSEAKAAREMQDYIFRDRKLRVELAYQKHCDPNKLNNNVLRMLFQNVGDVIALDQIPHQHMGYVCYRHPLSPETIKRLNQRIYRSKKIHFEKLDVGNLIKKHAAKSGGDSLDAASTSAQDGMLAATTMLTAPAASTPTAKKSKMKTTQKKTTNAGGTPSSTGGTVKKKVPRKNAATGPKASKAADKSAKAVKDDMP